MMLFISILLNAAQADSQDFTKHTAHALGEEQWSIGVFAPLRYGIQDKVDIEIHPGWALLAPHIAVKKSYDEKHHF